MPVSRTSSRRRRSSLALVAINPLKSSKFISAPSSKGGVTFAPNVTPVTYVEPDTDGLDSEPSSPTSKLFPPSAAPTAPTRKRLPPGKRRSQGYIPRPPNAFMLFRADFVRQKHVPGTIETNHGSLSKIIGNCWRALPLDEKRVWEIKAKHAKAEHKTMYPDYRFRPVHNKNKEKKAKVAIPAEDEQRCEDVAQMLLDGLKGEELAAAVKRLDRMRSTTPAAGPPRRPSSVPLPNAFPIALPALPFTQSRPQSPDFRLMRRPSSAQPFHAWTNPFSFTRPHSPLPEVNASLFQKDFLEHFPVAQPDGSFNFDSLFSSLPGGPAVHHDLNISPLDNIVPTDPSAYAPYTESADPYTWQAPPDISGASHSDPSSIYSGSPAPSDMSLPLHAPQPQRAFEHWMDMPAPKEQQQQHQQQQSAPNTQLDMQAYTQGLHDMGIVPGMGLDVSAFAGFDVSGMFAPEQCVQPPTFEFNDMIHEY